MNPATARVKQYLADIELTAETILADKEQVVELDRRRQKNREALRALKQLEEDIHRPWVCIGNMFMKIPRHRTKELLEQEQEKLENEIGSLRKKLKNNVQSLREMEGRSEVQGFSLEPLSREEMQAISQAMGQGMGTGLAPDALNVDAVVNNQYRMADAPACEAARSKSNVCRPPEYRAGLRSACDFCGHAPHSVI
ncbi:hypothetical protein MRX96_033558 [Rhipicephalus microplus]